MDRLDVILEQIGDINYWLKVCEGLYIYKINADFTCELLLEQDTLNDYSNAYLFITHIGMIGFERKLVCNESVISCLERVKNELMEIVI